MNNPHTRGETRPAGEKGKILYKHSASPSTPSRRLRRRDEKEKTHFQININSTSPKILVRAHQRCCMMTTKPMLISPIFSSRHPSPHTRIMDGDKHECLERSRKQIYTFSCISSERLAVCDAMKMWKSCQKSPCLVLEELHKTTCRVNCLILGLRVSLMRS